MTGENQILLALYPDGRNEETKIGKLLNKGGAAGKIYQDLSHNNSVAKIFHDREKSESNRQKLEAMLHNRPNIPTISNEGINYIQIAWPTALLEDSNGFCVGYLMPLIDTDTAVSLDHLIQKAVRKKLNLSERYIDRVFAAYNITSVVAALHACGHYIVDLKPSNVSIYKKTMLVALFDCDGFSIKGENNARYPAEYVSEEYIYPEGMNETCENMGEEQDKFALAVIIFKLLNEGIHPFSGTPRHKEDMLSIQERIAQYHYAYGMWPDTYQAPHPYSLHDYFDKETMNLFERAFTKGNQRPTALEWQNRLEYILRHLKQCKKDKNHAYFTPKGCGLCKINEKLRLNLDKYQKQKEEESHTIRGVDIKSLTIEKINEEKRKTANRKVILHRGYYIFIAAYFLFFTFLFKILTPVRDILLSIGIFAQLMLIVCGISLINRLFVKLPEFLPETKNQNLSGMLQIYAIVCLFIAFVSLNEIPLSVFRLAK